MSEVRQARREGDIELITLLERARKLRISNVEISNATGADVVKLWRWSNGVVPNYTTRQAFVEALERLIDERKQEYLDT